LVVGGATLGGAKLVKKRKASFHSLSLAAKLPTNFADGTSYGKIFP
jgi:hypothetical protein